MFTKRLEEVFSAEAFLEIEDPSIDKERLQEEILSLSYVPRPVRVEQIPKKDGSLRSIAIASKEDRAIQKILHNVLLDYFDHLFSDKSYAFRPKKGPFKAIRRVVDYLHRGKSVVFKSDIEDFFDSIDHQILLKLLHEHIQDRRIIKIIEEMLANSYLFQEEFFDHRFGIYQGDPLSPLLSNLYLDSFDKYLESLKIDFVRFADDFVLLLDHKDERLIPHIQSYLQSLKLRINEEKSYFATIKEGFEFLGIRFEGLALFIASDRFQEQKRKLLSLADEAMSVKDFLDKIFASFLGLQRYYLKLIDPNSSQYQELYNTFLMAIAKRVQKALASKEIATKKAARELLLHYPLDPHQSASILNLLTKKQDFQRKQRYYRQTYSQKLHLKKTLFITNFGVSIGVAKGSITVKEFGKLVKKIPKHQCEQIIVQSEAASISSKLIAFCATNKIPITFINKDYEVVGMFFSPAAHPLHLMQLQKSQHPSITLQYAKEFIHTKLKNQRNLLQYLKKHHQEIADAPAALKEKIDKIKRVHSKEELLGLEGSAASIYWETLRKVLADKVEFPARIHQGAGDVVNNALNYGYAILYAQIQKALLLANLNIYIPFYHAFDGKKPALVFDMIEEFRSFVVDRTVIALFNKKEPIKLSNGKLTIDSRKLIAKNILERLGSYTKYKQTSKKLVNIIQEQAYLLARSIKDEEPYSGFIGRY